jgi:hypothetical protein
MRKNILIQIPKICRYQILNRLTQISQSVVQFKYFGMIGIAKYKCDFIQ